MLLWERFHGMNTRQLFVHGSFCTFLVWKLIYLQMTQMTKQIKYNTSSPQMRNLMYRSGCFPHVNSHEVTPIWHKGGVYGSATLCFQRVDFRYFTMGVCIIFRMCVIFSRASFLSPHQTCPPIVNHVRVSLRSKTASCSARPLLLGYMSSTWREAPVAGQHCQAITACQHCQVNTARLSLSG